jgi:hypothetical protein
MTAVSTKTGLVQFLPPDAISPAPENARLYNAFSTANPDDRELVDSIVERDILNPIRVSADNVLVDGHRRLAAAKISRQQTVPVIVENVKWVDLSPSERVRLLAAYNQQRDKTVDERLAERIAATDPADAYAAVQSYRAARSQIEVESNICTGERRKRAKITTEAFFLAVRKLVFAHRDEWPVSNRFIHYLLLNDPPLTHDAKPESHYRNDLASSKKLSNLLTRMRANGDIPIDCICDDERPEQTWPVYREASAFIHQQQEGFLRGYWRDLMQSQPHHIEIIVEKRTRYALAQRVARNYTIPVTAGKGYASFAPRAHIFQRYQQSGKDRLVLVFLTDHDPDGEQIAASFTSYMMEDFDIPARSIFAVKAALTAEQVRTLDLPSALEAKESSPNFKRFVDKYGTRAVELDAMPGDVLEKALRDTIESVIDVDAFNLEVEEERQECHELEARRRLALEAIGAAQ